MGQRMKRPVESIPASVMDALTRYTSASDIRLRLKPFALHAPHPLVTLQRGSSSSAFRPGADVAGSPLSPRAGPVTG